MAMEDIVATDIVATDILATDTVATDTVATMVILLMEVITGEGTIVPTTGLITEAIMATHMVATTGGININEDSGLASGTKAEEDCGPKRAGVEAPAIMSPLILSFNTNVALAYIQCR